MKTRDMLLCYATIIVIVVLGTLLYTIRDRLAIYALWTLWVILGLLALAALAVLAFLLKNIHRHVNAMLLAGQEVAEKKYELTERKERFALEKKERLAAIHLQLSRVSPGQYLINPSTTILPSEQDIILLPGAPSRAGQGQMIPSRAASLTEPGQLPERVMYESIRHMIPEGQALLGVSAAGQVATCDFAQLMTMWICGGSSTGKSNTVALKIDEAIKNGRDIRLVVIDPHARKEDSLYNKIRCYEDRFLFRVAVTEEEIYAALAWYHQEFKRRLEAGGADTDLLLVCDEVSNVVASEDERIKPLVKEIARICGQESRGFGMFGWFISQKAAGLAWLRNVVITVIAHKMVMMSERILAANDDRSIARSMDQWPRGRVVVYGVEFEPQVYQMPIFTAPRVPGLAYEMEPLYYPGQDEIEEAEFYESTTEPILLPENIRFMTVDTQGETDDFSETEPETGEKKTEINRFSTLEEKTREVERLRALNFRQGEIMQRIWNVKPGANREYQEALREYKQITEFIVRGA